MAVVLRFPDRLAAGPNQTRETARPDRASRHSGEIVILPCIRREALERAAADELPAQLQA